MANKINLRQYQEELLARIQARVVSEAFDSTNATSRLGVMVGQDHVLVNLAEISEVIPMSECHPVPLTQAWFLGLANIRGNLYAVNDLSQLIGVCQASGQLGTSSQVDALAKGSEARLLLVNDAVLPQVSFLVDRVLGLRQLNQFTESTLQQEKVFCYSKQQYEDSDGKIWYGLDIQALIDSNIFLQPSFDTV